MAERQLIVKIIGDSRSLERSFNRSSRSAHNFDRDLGRASRGAISAAVSFRGLGRALAFGSFQFLGGAGIVFALKSTISAAEESQRVLAQTANAVTRSGQSWVKYGEQIQEAALAQSKLSGFDDERLLGTFSNLVRRTGDVTQALKLNALATDVARGKGIELESAQQLVFKASIGQVGALRRANIMIDKNATAYEALDLLQRKFAGSAARYGRTAAGAQDNFANAIQNTQEAIGTALLPTITTYLTKGADWLNQTENQKRIQGDVKTAVEGTAAAISALSSAIGTAIGVLRQFDDLTKGINIAPDLLKILQGKLGTGDKLIGTPGHRGLIGDLIGKLGVGSSPQNGGNFSQADLNKAKKALAPKTQDLAGPLGKLQGVVTPTRKGITPAKANQFFDSGISRILLRGGIGSLQQQLAAISKASTLIGKRLAVTKDVTRKLNLEDQLLQLSAEAKDIRGQIADDLKQKLQDAGQAILDALEFGVTKAQATASFTDDLQALSALQDGIRKRIAAEGKTLELQQQMFDVQQQIVQARKDQAAKRISDLTGKQFRQLGLTATGDEITPGVPNLKKRLQQLTANIAGTSLDTPKLQTQLAKFRKVLSEGLVPKDVRAKIREMFDDIADELNNLGGNRTRFSHVNSNAILSGLGLSPEQIRALRPRIAQIGAGGMVPGRRSLAFSGAGAQTIVMHNPQFNGITDVKTLKGELAKETGRRSTPRRGTYAGRH